MISADIVSEHGFFPIRTVAKVTGINPITLRAWERRYGLIKPVRTEKGHRLYSQQDIDTIGRIHALLEQGVSISQVPPLLQRAAFPTAKPAQMHDAADECASRTPSSWLHDYRSALTRLDEVALDILEADALGFIHPDELLAAQLLPLLASMEDGRLQSSAVDTQYRLLQTRLTQRLAHNARRLSLAVASTPCLVATLPPERSLFSLWHLVWRLRREDLDARMIGAGVPAPVLLHAMQVQNASSLILLLDHNPAQAVLGSQLHLLSAAGHRILAVGAYVAELSEILSPLGIVFADTDEHIPLGFIRQALAAN